MKNKRQCHFLLLIFFVCVSEIQTLKAQDTSTLEGQSGSTKLVGSDLKLEDAVSKSDVVFVGEVEEIGLKVRMFSKAPYAGPIYTGVKYKVNQSLKGSINPQASMTLFVDLTKDESLEKLQISYIFFAKNNDSRQSDLYTLFKLVPATVDNIAKVKALIAAAPASK